MSLMSPETFFEFYLTLAISFHLQEVSCLARGRSPTLFKVIVILLIGLEKKPPDIPGV